MRRVISILFSPNEQCGGRGGGGMLPDFFFCSLFLVQQTTSRIGHRVKYSSFFGLATNTLNARNNIKLLDEWDCKVCFPPTFYC